MPTNNLPLKNIEITADYPIIEGLKVSFTERLTILSGSNGTGKSSILRKIKEEKKEEAVLYNPKRNSVKKELLQAISEVRGGPRSKQNLLQELNRSFDDNTSHPYPSFSETIAAEYEDIIRKPPGNKSPEQIVEELKQKFGKYVPQIFPKYKAIDWKFDGGPYFKIEKFGKHTLETNQLSTGEQEVLSLVFSILTIIDSKDLILIDEPELHLNWSLEEKLFSFLKKVAVDNNKQIIVATHSRIITKDKFNQNTIYLFFDADKKIKTSSSIPKSIRKEIVGDVIETIAPQSGEISIFVEDEFHKKILKLIAAKENAVNKLVTYRGINKKTVINLYRVIKASSSPNLYDNSYFMVDGDNEKEKFTEDDNFIWLARGYNLETYFINNIDNINKFTGISVSVLKRHITEIINERKSELLRNKNDWRYAGKIDQRLITSDMLSSIDGKIILPKLVEKIGYPSENKYIEDYLDFLYMDKRKMRGVFDQKLIKFIRALSS